MNDWRANLSAATRTNRAAEPVARGSMGGRVRQAKPRPARITELKEPEEDLVHVAPTSEPPNEIYRGRLWFRTDAAF